MIKSMSIPTKWANHKPENDYTTDVVPRREDSEFHVKLPSLRVLQKEESPEGPALNFHRTEGNRDSTLGGWEQDTNKLWLAPRPREEQ